MGFLALATVVHVLVAPSGPFSPRDAADPVRWWPTDDSRARRIPVAVYEPPSGVKRHPRLVLLSHGFGVPNTEYGFLARALAAAGYQVLSVQHQLPGDPPPPTDGDRSKYIETLMAESVLDLRFVATTAASFWPWMDKRHVILIGHSFGGDVSAVMATESPDLVSDLITLDHGRVPLPRARRPRQLSLRAGERPPQPGVLPTAREQRRLGIRVVRLAEAKHMDFTDSGPAVTRAKVVEQVMKHLERRTPE
jgi:pimeloyl-ACP methyl ester carboxylesterase